MTIVSEECRAEMASSCHKTNSIFGIFVTLLSIAKYTWLRVVELTADVGSHVHVAVRFAICIRTLTEFHFKNTK